MDFHSCVYFVAVRNALVCNNVCVLTAGSATVPYAFELGKQ